MISGPAAAWLKRERDGLNLRVRLARHHGQRVDPALLGAWLDWLLPKLSARGAGDDLLLATFELVLLLTGRGRVSAPDSADRDGQTTLLHALPELTPVLAKRPTLLAAFSNAAGNLGDDGTTFVAALPRLAASCPVERLLDAGVVLAWRVGEARLRERALDLAGTLPAPTVAAALAVSEAQVGSCLTALRNNGWRRPDLTRQTGSVLYKIGDFHGLGGPFAGLPEILASSTNHQLQVRCGRTTHHLTVDGFGWRAQAAATTAASVSRPAVPATAKAHLDRASSWMILPSPERPQVLVSTRHDSFRLCVVDLEPA